VHVYAGPDPDRARAALQRYLDARLATQSAHFQEKVKRDPRHASASAIEESGFALFGTAADVRERLRAYESAGVDELLGMFDFGGLAVGDAQRSVRDLGAEFARRT
jgi:alkanesulfonate monooxygenase SsuD/methylene tetrahydromethanopterin reductase-like flavin-dependent oxidoreductase (luciferase family)